MNFIQPEIEGNPIQANAKLTHGSLKAADGSKTGRGEGAEAAEAASVTEPVKLWPHVLNDPRGEPLGAAYVRPKLCVHDCLNNSEFFSSGYAPAVACERLLDGVSQPIQCPWIGR